MQSTKVTERIKATAFELLEAHPEGLRFSELQNKIKEADPAFNSNTINGCIWDLDSKFPSKVYKSSKGLFRLTKFKEAREEEAPSGRQTPSHAAK